MAGRRRARRVRPDGVHWQMRQPVGARRFAVPHQHRRQSAAVDLRPGQHAGHAAWPASSAGAASPSVLTRRCWPACSVHHARGLLRSALLWALGWLARGASGWALAGALLIVVRLRPGAGARVRAAAPGAWRRPGTARHAGAAAARLVGRGAVQRRWCSAGASPFAAGAGPTTCPPTAQGRRGVLLVHGFVCNRGMWNPWLAAPARAQGVPFVAVNLEPVFGSIDDYVAIIEAAVQRLEQCHRPGAGDRGPQHGRPGGAPLVGRGRRGRRRARAPCRDHRHARTAAPGWRALR